ncbi:cAMP-binding domain-containing protein [Listeria grandensis FSL F6-0971]|uniref:cAMP-binding domain-containing protein n=2 Tax=Listeria grandensis TaxID=1494963 RepID=W7BKE8_9LIST|nr:cAMP-binding domain-containing protein [Listeria grandensis FSL F6-0971]
MRYLTEMHFLYNDKIVHEEFNKEQFFHFLQDDSFLSTNKVAKQYRKKEVLIREQEEVRDLFFIKEGCVMATQESKRVMSFHASGDIIGLENLILYSDAKYSFEVISDKVSIIKCNKAEMVEKILNAQEGYLYYYIHLQNLIQHLRNKEELLRLSSEQRINLVLFCCALKYGEKKHGTTKVCFPKYINKGIIAKYSNLNPNTVTVSLQKLEEAKIIESVRRKMYIDLAKLEKRLDGC